MAPSGELGTLEYTPTWVVALVCSVIVIISILIERFLHYLGKFLKHNNQKALFHALQKVKEELMLLGFISLLLIVLQGLVSNICVDPDVQTHMLPCKREEQLTTHHTTFYEQFWNPMQKHRRLPAEESNAGHCLVKGKIPLLSLEALHQLHIFIFVLAVVHVLFCATTMVLGVAKIQKWKHWERHARMEDMKPEKHRPGHPHHQFINERVKGFWRKSTAVSWMASFFKQFHASVTKADYLALRHGFIMKHCRSNPNFDFHKYMMRTLEADFKKVVGISWYLWLFVLVFLLLNVAGWHAYFWLSFLPLILLLIVGAKLEHIITRLAQDALANSDDNERAPHIKPSDEHFWFQQPNIVLYLIHFILFQNAFEIAFFFWILCTYGFHSCIMENVAYVVPRLTIGVIIQVLCSYSTLPLYALVTQMGDMFKKSIFEEHMQATLQGWIEGIRQKHQEEEEGTLPSILKRIGAKKEKAESSNGAIRTQKMTAEVSERTRTVHHPINLEGMLSSVVKHPESSAVQHLPYMCQPSECNFKVYSEALD